MASRSDTELLTEHFGYPPVSLLDLIINTTNTLADRALTSIESGLLGAPPSALGFRPPTHEHPAESHRNEVEEGVHKLETLLFAALDKNFDKFEIYTMRFLLTVAGEDEPFTVLGHYKGLDFNLDDTPGQDGEGMGVGGLNQLRRQLQESQKLRGMLEAERARNEGLLTELRRLVGTGVKEENGGQKDKAVFGFLSEGRKTLEGVDRHRPLETTAKFGVSQLGSLRDLSSGLRELLPRLGDTTAQDIGDGDGEQETKDWRRERLEYVEAATRRHLENVRGLELTENGAVRDDVEGVGEGRSKQLEVGIWNGWWDCLGWGILWDRRGVGGRIERGRGMGIGWMRLDFFQLCCFGW
ncbi:Mis12 protein-domain-containing protein [Apiosordaria backusii]|uniref:Mis12 protein-domain-containing protein n=1 Tax=Apiosordaria backusii TaxID=314023 RepID=A0AA40F0J1_9PEZI|nr:Mis12 protein-domain-containing protein [Apiosordaria backusii]